jgi:hypothetical protein
MHWDGSVNGFAGEVVDGIGLTPASIGAMVAQLNATQAQDDPTAGNTFDDYDDMADQAGDALAPQLYLPAISN